MEARPWRTGPHAPHRTAKETSRHDRGRRRGDRSGPGGWGGRGLGTGGGPGVEVAAARLADGGLSVALVERELIGGECSYWACIPSKTLLRPGDILAEARRVPGAAEAVAGPIDVAAALKQRDYMTSSWDDSGQVPWLEEKGIAVLRGHGRLAGERVVEGEGGDGSTTRLTARMAVVLATGPRSLIPPIPGLREAEPW